MKPVPHLLAPPPVLARLSDARLQTGSTCRTRDQNLNRSKRPDGQINAIYAMAVGALPCLQRLNCVPGVLPCPAPCRAP